MSWFGGGGKPPPPPPMDEAGSGQGKLAGPPSCPRCDLTKAQMNRTIQNYQKAYRKKVEGLKTELATTRADNGTLRNRVMELRRRKVVHVPSLAIGGLLGWLAAKHLAGLVSQLRQRLAQPPPAEQQQQQQQQSQPQQTPPPAG